MCCSVFHCGSVTDMQLLTRVLRPSTRARSSSVHCCCKFCIRVYVGLLCGHRVLWSRSLLCVYKCLLSAYWSLLCRQLRLHFSIVYCSSLLCVYLSRLGPHKSLLCEVLRAILEIEHNISRFYKNLSNFILKKIRVHDARTLSSWYPCPPTTWNDTYQAILNLLSNTQKCHLSVTPALQPHSTTTCSILQSYIYIHMYINIYTWICIYVYAYTVTHMYVCMYAYMHIYIYIQIYTYIYSSIYLSVHIYVSYVYIYTYINTHISMYTCTHVYKHKCAVSLPM